MAWLLVAILLVLIALAARIDAAPASDAIARAVRYANLMTGVDPDDDDGDPEASNDDHRDPDGAAADPRLADPIDPDGAAADPTLADPIDLDGPAADPMRADPIDPDGPAADPMRADPIDLDGPAADPTLADPIDLAAPWLATPGRVHALLDGEPTVAAAVPQGAARTGHERWPRWGELHVRVAWRRRWRETTQPPARRSDELWFIATWSR